MKQKTIKITYWTITAVFSLFFLFDGIASVMRVQSAVALIAGLSYPVYLLTITGAAKIAGSIMLFQNKLKTLKEWAFAGFTIDFLGASLSYMFVTRKPIDIISPLIFLAVLFVLHYFWKRYETLPAPLAQRSETVT